MWRALPDALRRLFWAELPSGFAIYVALVLAGTGIGISRRTRALASATLQAQRDRERAEKELAVARLEALQAQLNPHFLFNALNSAAELVHEDRESADQLIRRLSAVLRSSLQQSPTARVTLSEELQLVQAYLGIEQVRFSDRLRFSIDCSAELLPLTVPRFLLQPLVENAIKHGIAQTDRGGEIDVRVQRLALGLQFEVRNTAAPGTNNTSGFGSGLANLRERLAHLYSQPASVALQHENGWTVARVVLPLT